MDSIPSALSQLLADAVDGKVAWPLYLYGATGAGKTCAALCLCDHVADSAYRRHRELSEELLRASKGQLFMQTPGSSITVSVAMVWERVARAPLAVLDEIGLRERASDYSYEVLYDFLEARTGMPTIVIGNHGLTVVAGVYDDRIASRIGAGTVVQVASKDLRDRRGT